jgi:hypothetical protein
MLAYRTASAALLTLSFACAAPSAATDDDDDGTTVVGSGAGGGGGTGGAAGAMPTAWSARVEWQVELDSFAQIARDGGANGDVYVDDSRYDPNWHIDKFDAAGALVLGGGWPIDHAPPEATYAGRFAVGADGSLVLVGAESLGWRTTKLGPSGAVEWVRVRGTESGARAEGASISPNGAITVVGSATFYPDCMITRYLSDGTELDEVWLQTLTGSLNCRYVVSDDDRVYVPSAMGSDGTLHVFDAKSGAELATTPLPGADGGGEVGLLSLAPGGGVIVGAHEPPGTTDTTRHLWLAGEDGTILWEQHLPNMQGRMGARADGTLIASVVAPPLAQGGVSGTLALYWYRREANDLIEAGSTSLGTVHDPIVTTVVALPDGSFAVEWATDVMSTQPHYWLAKIRPEPIE